MRISFRRLSQSNPFSPNSLTKIQQLWSYDFLNVKLNMLNRLSLMFRLPPAICSAHEKMNCFCNDCKEIWAQSIEYKILRQWFRFLFILISRGADDLHCNKTEYKLLWITWNYENDIPYFPLWLRIT